MGIFWDLLQENKLQKQQQQTEGIENRVAILESELFTTQELLRKTLEALEKHLDRDIDGDGLTG